MLKVGDGKFAVSLALDTLPSFLPFGTYQYGPPAWKDEETSLYYHNRIVIDTVFVCIGVLVTKSVPAQ